MSSEESGLFIVVTQTTPKFSGLKQECYTSQLSGPRGQAWLRETIPLFQGASAGITEVLIWGLALFHMASHYSGASHTIVVIFLSWQLFCKNKRKEMGTLVVWIQKLTQFYRTHPVGGEET